MKIVFRDKVFDTRSGITARDAIKKMGLDPESVLVVVNGRLCTDDVILKDEDQVKLVAVVSGGSNRVGRRIGQSLVLWHDHAL